jgi:hypothetical protein
VNDREETRRMKRWRGFPGWSSRVKVEDGSGWLVDASKLIEEPERTRVSYT